MAWCRDCGEPISMHKGGALPYSYVCPERPKQAALDGSVVEILPGDKGEQGALLGSPASTGEGLSLKGLPMFKEEND